MTQAQHAQQAAELARAEGHPQHVLIGALLHDIGDLNVNVCQCQCHPPHVLIGALLHDIGDLKGRVS